MSFLSPSSFTGKYKVQTGMYVNSDIQDYIDKYEKIYLLKLLGATLYDQFMNDIDQTATPWEPQSPNFITIYEPFHENISPFQLLISEGMIEMLKGFIYFEYCKDLITTQTVYGEVQQKPENSTFATSLNSQMWDKYNASVKTFNSIRTYIYLNLNNYVLGQIITLNQLWNSTNYLSGAKNIVVAQGWVLTASVYNAGTNYTPMNNLAVTHPNGAGLLIDILTVGGGGEILTFSIARQGYGYNTGSQYAGVIHPTGVGGVIELDLLGFSSGTVIGSPTLNVTADTIGGLTNIVINNPGTSYTTADDVALTGGSGGFATADIVDTAGVLTSVTINNGGSGYQVGDVLTVDQGLQNGDVTVTAVSNGSITSLTVTDAIKNNTKEFEIGDRVRISGNGNTLDAVYEVSNIGTGEYDLINGVEMLYNYWI